jgi:hypothetical protein
MVVRRIMALSSVNHIDRIPDVDIKIIEADKGLRKNY